MIPHEFSLFNYEVAFTSIPLVRYYLNTIFVTVVHTFLAVFFALMCGYAFAKGNFVGKKFWFIFMLAVMMLPFESRMIPLYLQYKSWGLLDTYAPLLMGACAYVYGIFFAKQNIEAIPDSLRESAYIDGASEWRIFLKIILPLSKPLIATLSILQVLSNWNSYLWAAGCSAQLGKTADFRRSFYFQFPAGCDLLWTENGCGGDQCNSFEYYVLFFAEIHCAKYRSQRNQAVILYQSNRSAG